MLIGTDSPVSADESIKVFPDNIIPSRGTLSPGFITIISPILTSSGDTCTILLSLSKLAYSAFISISSDIDFLDLFTA